METRESEIKLYTTKEVCAMFGINASTLWRWRKRRWIAPVRFGKLVRYRRQDVELLAQSKLEGAWW